MKKLEEDEIKTERELVKNLKVLFEGRKPSSLKMVFSHTNLATKEFHDIWSQWWGSEILPRLEVDMILVFEDIKGPNKVLIAGVEVEFFKKMTKSFCEGLQQVLSFGLFGFDSLVLWHIFTETMENKNIERCVRPAEEIIKGFNLPITYFATKLVEKDKFEFFAPWKLYPSRNVDVDYLLSSLRECCNEKKNPLLGGEEIGKRRGMLKIILQIPV